jgi:hypothetical protein
MSCARNIFILLSYAFLFSFSPTNIQASIINFNGDLDYIEFDKGGGIYSGVAIGTEFSGVIDDENANGSISDGTTITSFGCCIAAGGLTVENDVILTEEDASFLNTISGSSQFSNGDKIDAVNIEGDKITLSGGRVEIGLSYVLDSSAFPNNDLRNYPFNSDKVKLAMFFIFEEDAADQNIFSAGGKIQQPISPPTDECPDDPNKTEPGECGCGTPDTDGDGDGIPDCNDTACSDIAGEWVGDWSETSCDNLKYSGSWSGTVLSDCTFTGTDNWDTVSGPIDPSTMELTATGISHDGCGVVNVKGNFTINSVSGNYTYSISGGGTFSGQSNDGIKDNSDDDGGGDTGSGGGGGGGGGCFVSDISQ